MSAPTTAALSRALDELRHGVRDPFSLFAVEALRSFGAPVPDDPPAAKLQPRVDAAVEAYRTAVLQADPFEDLLGLVYQEENSTGQRDMNGQFFTPWALCRLIAQAQVVNDWKPGPGPDGGLWTVYEPACGAGGMMLAVCAELVARFRTPEVLLLWDLTMEDLDLTCARTAALQILANLALRGWSIGRVTVHHANALSRARFSTVLHATNGRDPEELPRMWAQLAPAVAMAGLIDQVQALVDEALPPPVREPVVDARGQLTMFSEEEAA